MLSIFIFVGPTGAGCAPHNTPVEAMASTLVAAAPLARFFFVLGQTALQHLLCIEQLGKAIRQARLAAGRAAAEAADKAREAAAAAGRKGSSKAGLTQQQQQQDDIAGMLGAGAVSADAELDDLVELIESQV